MRGCLFQKDAFRCRQDGRLRILCAEGNQFLSVGPDIIECDQLRIFLLGVVPVEPHGHGGDSFFGKRDEFLAAQLILDTSTSCVSAMSADAKKTQAIPAAVIEVESFAMRELYDRGRKSSKGLRG